MLAVGQEFDQTAVGLPGIHLVSNHLKALPQLPTAQMLLLLLCSSLQFLAVFGCTGVLCVHPVSDRV